MEAEQWFPGEDLARFVIAALAESDGISTDPENDLVEEDWGWCVCLKVGKEPFFLGVGEDADVEFGWRIFIAKDFDFIARFFRKMALAEAVETLKRRLDTVLQSRGDVTNVRWAEG